MRVRDYWVVIILLLFPMFAGAGNQRPDAPPPRHNTNYLRDTVSEILYDERTAPGDTLGVSADERNKRFYDSLQVKSRNNFLSRTIHDLLIVSDSEGKAAVDKNVIDETKRYMVYEGMPINDIWVITNNVFQNPGSSLQKGINSTHMVTRKRTVRRDLLFKKGDMLDAELIVKNKQLIRSRNYIYNADIQVEPNPDDSTSVNVYIKTSDNWSIGVDGAIWGLTGRIAGDVYDNNLLGLGNKFRYRLSMDWKGFDYGGSFFEYSIPNFLGTFYQTTLQAGRSFWDTRYVAKINKKFILDSDYEIGAEYYNVKSRHYILYQDYLLMNRNVNVSYRSYDVWVGKSFRLPTMAHNSIYGMVRYYGDRYDNPKVGQYDLEVGKGLNPALHSGDLYLASLGFYRERFLTTNMVYGYGVREYLGIGYRFELVGGYHKGEFEQGLYGGFSFKQGNFTDIGYFMAEMSVGTFYDTKNREPYRSALNASLTYFTKLINIGRSNMRNFATLRYVRGWNRETGADEWLNFTNVSGPRNFPVKLRGRERATLSMESVVFTPWKPLGFRMAMYGFADLGLIGNNGLIFKDNFYSTIGIGVRLRNERLVFSTLQLSFCVALNKRGVLTNSKWVNVQGMPKLSSMRYIPERPEIVEFK